MDIDPELKNLVATGATLRLFYGEGNINNQVVHVRAIVDESQVVCRTWSERKQRWFYRIEPFAFFVFAWNDGYLEKA